MQGGYNWHTDSRLIEERLKLYNRKRYIKEVVMKTATFSASRAGIISRLKSKRWLWQGKTVPAFWTISGLISLTINIILIVALILIGQQLFALKNLLSEQLIGGLYANFVRMDNAHIVTQIQVQDTIHVEDTMPVVFDLPLSQETTVVLTQDTKIPNTWVALSTYGQGINLSITAPANITLPAGAPLNIKLDMIVPVNQTIPVSLNVPVNLIVPVDIPLAQTQLHEPFVGLREVLEPYHGMLTQLPNSWEETPLCSPLTRWFCRWILIP
jgi:hypothetical protein